MTPIEEESKEDEHDIGLEEDGVSTKPLEFKLNKVTSIKSSSDVSETRVINLQATKHV